MKMCSLYKALFTVCALNAATECTLTVEEELTLAETAIARLKHMVLQGRPRDCADLYAAGQKHSGIYNIFPTEGSTGGVFVYCDMESDGGGWTVIQRRGLFGNPVYYFYKDWEAYASGFGDPAKEYWLGNRAIHALTSNKPMTLRIQLENHTGETLTADYKMFKIASEEEQFRITVRGYGGEEGADAFGPVDGTAFSTRDRDHDTHATENCARLYKGGWWYTACHSSNLNGLNLDGEHDSYADGIEWSARHGFQRLYHYSYPEVEMKIRGLSSENGQDSV